MAEDYEEFADMAVAELRDFIDTEKQIVIQEHMLLDKLTSWDAIIMYLNEIIPQDAPHLHDLSREISLGLIAIRDLVEEGMLRDVGYNAVVRSR